MKLGGDPEIHVDTKRVVLGDERSSQRTSRLGLEYRCFYLDKTSGFELAAQLGNDRGPRECDVPGVFIDQQVEFPLPVPAFLVLKSVPLLRERP